MTSQTKDVRIDLRIDLATRRKLKALLDIDGETVSGFLRRAIEERLAKNPTS